MSLPLRVVESSELIRGRSVVIFPSQSGETRQIATPLRSSPSSPTSPSIALILSTFPALGGKGNKGDTACRAAPLLRPPSPWAFQGQLLLSPVRGTQPGRRQTDASVRNASFVQDSREGRSSLPSPGPGPERRGPEDPKPGRRGSACAPPHFALPAWSFPGAMR